MRDRGPAGVSRWPWAARLGGQAQLRQSMDSQLRLAGNAPINVAQKNMDDDRYGRERQLVDALGHNSLTTNATARLFQEIFNGESFSDRARHRMQQLIHR